MLNVASVYVRLVGFLDENESGARKVWANRNNADYYVDVRASLLTAVFLLPEPTDSSVPRQKYLGDALVCLDVI